MAKITKATFKSFVRNNPSKLMVMTKSSFDAMEDGCRSISNARFVKASDAEYTFENNLGINGIWLVGGSRNYFNSYNKDGFKGIEVSNSCGHFIVATKE